MGLDYSKLGFKSGLEIHQQLDTSKLFCNCPSVLRSDKGDFEVRRKLHAIAGETGEVDEAVKHEAEKDKEFVYQGFNDTTCLVELDEEPPHQINNSALKIGLQIALLLNCEIIPVTQIMRKTVIDGSNTSGFQRTVLIAQNGFIETSYGKVKIDTVILEEDAARIVEKQDNFSIYKLDRLGIPLIEIATSPDMKNPEQVKEAALHLGDILRACKVKRGIGTIRQDVNVSVKGHPRVEIKGFQDVKIFVKTIETEVERQLNNIKSKNIKSEVRNALADGNTEFLRPMPGSARMYPETDLPLMFISRNFINEVKNSLPKLRADIRDELKSKGLNEEMIKLVISENKIEELKSLLEIENDANLIAKMLVLWPKEFAKKEKLSLDKINEKLNIDVLEEVLKYLNKNIIQKHDIQDILYEIVQGKNFQEVIKRDKISLDKVEEFVIKLIKQKSGLTIGAYMGLVMKEFKGMISGKQASDIIGKYLR